MTFRAIHIKDNNENDRDVTSSASQASKGQWNVEAKYLDSPPVREETWSLHGTWHAINLHSYYLTQSAA
jgi:hypothetical protein